MAKSESQAEHECELSRLRGQGVAPGSTWESGRERFERDSWMGSGEGDHENRMQNTVRDGNTHCVVIDEVDVYFAFQ